MTVDYLNSMLKYGKKLHLTLIYPELLFFVSKFQQVSSPTLTFKYVVIV